MFTQISTFRTNSVLNYVIRLFNVVLFALFQQHTVTYFVVADAAEVSLASICTSRQYKIARNISVYGGCGEHKNTF